MMEKFRAFFRGVKQLFSTNLEPVIETASTIQFQTTALDYFESGEWTLLENTFKHADHSPVVIPYVQQRVNSIVKGLIIPDELTDFASKFRLTELARELARTWWRGATVIEVYRDEDGALKWLSAPFYLFDYDRKNNVLKYDNKELDMDGVYVFTVSPPMFLYAAPLIRMLEDAQDKWFKYMKRFVAPVINVKIPTSGIHEDPVKKQAQLQNIKRLFENLDQKEVIVSSDNVQTEFVMPPSNSGFAEFVNYVSAELEKLILGQTLTSQHGDRGSYALGRVHYAVREDILEIDRLFVEQSVNQILTDLGMPEIEIINRDMKIAKYLEAYQIGWPLTEEMISEANEYLRQL